MTTDLSIAGRHFRLDWHQPEAVGHRALARGLSDLAAMGARPVAAFLSLGLPRSLATAVGRRSSWFERFLDGLLALAEAYSTPLAGGDLAESPVAVADIVLIGAVPRGRALLRSGAKPGDLLYVTGALGGTAVGLDRLEKLASPAQSQPATHPQKAGSAAGRAPLSAAAHCPGTVAATPRSGLRRARPERRPFHRPGSSVRGVRRGRRGRCGSSAYPCGSNPRPGPPRRRGLLELLFTASATAKLPRAITGVRITRIGRITRPRAGQPTITLLRPARPSTAGSAWMGNISARLKVSLKIFTAAATQGNPGRGASVQGRQPIRLRQRMTPIRKSAGKRRQPSPVACLRRPSSRAERRPDSFHIISSSL